MLGVHRRYWRRLVAAVMWAGMLPACGASQATESKDTLSIPDLADLWWDPAQSGWGMQIVQGGSTLFATLFVYDASGQPPFYTATLESGASGWTGDLYRTTGPYLGLPNFDPATVILAKVGTLSFAAPVNDVATLQYTVNGVNVTKHVQRQLLRYDDYNGRYSGTPTLTRSNCLDPAMHATTTGPTTLSIVQAPMQMTIDMSLPAGEQCTYSGPYSQLGHVGALAASFTCTSGAAGALSFFRDVQSRRRDRGPPGRPRDQQRLRLPRPFRGADPAVIAAPRGLSRIL